MKEGWKETPAGSLIDWNKQRSNYPDSLRFGKDVNIVTINGIDASQRRITQLRTGEGGYITYLVLDSHGRPTIAPFSDELAKVTQTGFVRHWYDPSGPGGCVDDKPLSKATYLYADGEAVETTSDYNAKFRTFSPRSEG